MPFYFIIFFTFLCPFVSAQLTDNAYSLEAFSGYFDILINFLVPFFVFIIVDYDFDKGGSKKIAQFSRSFIYLIIIGLQQEVAYAFSSDNVSNLVKILQHIVFGLLIIEIIGEFVLFFNSRETNTDQSSDNEEKFFASLKRQLREQLQNFKRTLEQSIESQIQNLKQTLEDNFNIKIQTLENKFDKEYQNLVVKIENIENQIKPLKGYINDLKICINQLIGDIYDIYLKIDGINKRISSLYDYIDKEIDKINKKISPIYDYINERIDDINKKINFFYDQINKKIDDIDKDVKSFYDQIKKNIDDISKRITSLHDYTKTLEKRIKALEEKMSPNEGEGEEKKPPNDAVPYYVMSTHNNRPNSTLIYDTGLNGLNLVFPYFEPQRNFGYHAIFSESESTRLCKRLMFDISETDVTEEKIVLETKSVVKYEACMKDIEISPIETNKTNLNSTKVIPVTNGFINPRIFINIGLLIDYLVLVLFITSLGILLNDLKENITRSFVITIAITVSLTFTFQFMTLIIAYNRKNLHRYIEAHKQTYSKINPKYPAQLAIANEIIIINVLYLPCLTNYFLLQTPVIFNKIFLNLTALFVSSWIVLMYKTILTNEGMKKAEGEGPEIIEEGEKDFDYKNV